MKTKTAILHWFPRIICILAILFVSIFAFDVFSPDLTIWQQLLALAMHLIPSFILLAALIIAWKWEFVGGIIFIIAGIYFTIDVFMLNYHRTGGNFWISLGIVGALTIPFIIVGILFIASYKSKKKALENR
jgi:hypothetical protein